MIILINNARCVDPQSGYDAIGSVLYHNGVIQNIFEGGADDNVIADRIIDAKGHVLCPSLCDIFTGVSATGDVHKDNLASISKAALSAGITDILIDPDGSPLLDRPEAADYVQQLAHIEADINIHLSAALSRNLQESEMTDMVSLMEKGVKCLTQGDRIFKNSLLLSSIFSYAAKHDLVMACHSGDAFLSQRGICHESFLSTLYGLTSVPATAEHIGLHRDILLAKYSGAKLHIRSLSSAGSADIIRQAKSEGVDVTASVSLQHICLNENDILPYRTFLKMRPPIRDEEDRMALVQAVCDGTIDIVYAQHRPRHGVSKRLPFAEADFGCSSIESLLPLMLELYHRDECSLAQALRPVTIAPRKRFGIEGGVLQKGAHTDLILVDIDKGFQHNRQDMLSSASNTPYEGRLMQGKCLEVFKK